MPRLTREEFMNRISAVIGDDTSDESMSFIEDMTETFDGLTHDAQSDGTDWEKKYHENDEAWKKRYKNMFFNGSRTPNFGNSGGNPGGQDDDDDEEDTDSITFADLFKK